MTSATQNLTETNSFLAETDQVDSFISSSLKSYGDYMSIEKLEDA